METKPDKEHAFGGPWTELKLDALFSYLGFFTTALKEKRFILWYVDAFAGSGQRTASKEDGGIFEGRPVEVRRVQLDGSATRALNVSPSFQHFVFIEADAGRHAALCALRDAHPSRSVECRAGDANEELVNLFTGSPWNAQVGGSGPHRAVVFLDPYDMSVRWQTLRTLAQTGSIDVWYLFPLNAVVRQLARNGKALDASKERALTEIFGSASWKDDLYETKVETDLFDTIEHTNRVANQRQIEAYAKKRLETLFAYVSEPLPLLTERGAQLFSLFFLGANKSPAAIALARKGATAIIRQHGRPASHRRGAP